MKIMNHTSRRTFIKTAAVVSLSVSASLTLARKVFAQATNYIGARSDGVYNQDRKMKYRKSQDNPMVKELYRDFLKEPNSHEAHHLLHTEYSNRSAKVAGAKKKGVVVNL